MALSALLLLAGFAQQSLTGVGMTGAYAQSSPLPSTAPDNSAASSIVEVQAKQRARTLSLVVKNNDGSGTDIYGFEVYLSDNEVKKFKAPAGWKTTADGSDSSGVTFVTEDRPIGEGMKKTFRITLADRAPAPLEWSALDKDGNEAASGEWPPQDGTMAGQDHQQQPPTQDTEHFRQEQAATGPKQQQPLHGQDGELFVGTDREVYSPGDYITVYGKGDPHAAVIIRLFDQSGNVLAKAEVKPNGNDGMFKFESKAPGGKAGTYVIEASQGGNVAKAKFMIKGGEEDGRDKNAPYYPRRQAATTIKVWTDRPEYWQGENVTVLGQAYPDAKVRITVFNREGATEFHDEVAAGPDGAFKAAYSLNAKAPPGERKVLAEVATDDGQQRYSAGATFRVNGETVDNSSRTALPAANASPSIAGAADQEQYKPDSLVRITAKTTSPGPITIAVYPPDGGTVAKKEVQVDRSGVAVLEYKLGADAPGGTWSVLAVQGPSQARDTFDVVRPEAQEKR
jgi:hypothetical protein